MRETSIEFCLPVKNGPHEKMPKAFPANIA
jgi:hypothetical protein